MNSNTAILRLSIAFAASVACLGAYAQSAAGNWTGHIDFTAVKPANANEQKQLSTMKSMLAGKVFKLTLRADKTYIITFPAASAAGVPSSEKGKWSQKGNIVTCTDPNGHDEAGTLSAKDKDLTMIPPANQGAPKGLKLVFKRN